MKTKEKKQYPPGKHPNSLKNLKPIQPGEARNPKGRPPGVKYISEALREQLANKRAKIKSPADQLAHNLIERAEKSDSAISIVLERTEGKVTQPIAETITGDITFIIGKGYAKDKPDLQPDQ